MKSFVLLLLFARLVTGWVGKAVAQESANNSSRDTVAWRVRIVDPAISFGTPVFLLSPSLTLTRADLLGAFRPAMRSQPPPFLSSAVGEQIDLLAPLKLQLKREEELSTLYTILGTVELGGVAYIAYRHIKKYGFK